MRTGALNKLAAKSIKSALDGMHSDGGGLFLRVRGVSRVWLFRFTEAGKKREIGFGSAMSVSLADARTKATEARKMLGNGGDPRKAKAVAAARKVPTFRAAMETYITKNTPTWSNVKHAQQWTRSLEGHADSIMDKPVDEIEVRDIEAVLDPIWLIKIETASRVRQRMEKIFSLCIARGDRPAPNPAAWSDNLEHILPGQKKVAKVKHHAAVPVADAPAVFAKLWERRALGFGYAGLIFVALTALRSGEVRFMIRDDLDGDTITIPEGRMKSRRDHSIPLTPFAAKWIDEQHGWSDTSLIFPGQLGKAMSDMTMAKAQKFVAPGTTVHGWRSTFRDWAAQNGWAGELAEYQLAHAVGNAVEQAYQRSDLIERRREMMAAWEGFVTSGIVAKLRVVA